jgi:hypothetical protein
MTKKEMMLLDKLDEAFRTLERIPLKSIPKLEAIMHQAKDDALEAIVRRKIPFCDTVANSELIKRGLRPGSAKLDHVIDILISNHI